MSWGWFSDTEIRHGYTHRNKLEGTIFRGKRKLEISTLKTKNKLRKGQAHQLWVISDDSGEGNGTPLQYSCLENPMDGGAWWATVHGVAKSHTRLSDFIFIFHSHALEKEMATHSSVLALRIPGTGEPGALPSMGSHRAGHDWSDLAAAILCYMDVCFM